MTYDFLKHVVAVDEQGNPITPDGTPIVEPLPPLPDPPDTLAGYELAELVRIQRSKDHKPGWVLYKAFKLDLDERDINFLAEALDYDYDWVDRKYEDYWENVQVRMKDFVKNIPKIQPKPSSLSITNPQSTTRTEQAMPQQQKQVITSQYPTLEDLWGAVLKAIFRPGTQALLKQWCDLVAFDGETAIVQIRSQPLLRMAVSKKQDLVDAFKAVTGVQVEVILQVGDKV